MKKEKQVLSFQKLRHASRALQIMSGKWDKGT